VPSSEPAAAAAPSARAPPAAVGGRNTIRVSKTSHPGKVAGHLIAQLEERPDDRYKLAAAGAAGCSIAVRALAYARSMLMSSRRVTLEFQPQWSAMRPNPGDGAEERQQQQEGARERSGERPETFSGVVFWARAAAVDPSEAAGDAPGAPSPHDMRVSASTGVQSLTGAIVGFAKEKGAVRMRCVGGPALLVALNALSQARRSLVLEVGKDLMVTAEVEPITFTAGEGEAGAAAAEVVGEGEGSSGAGEDERTRTRTVGECWWALSGGVKVD